MRILYHVTQSVALRDDEAARKSHSIRKNRRVCEREYERENERASELDSFAVFALTFRGDGERGAINFRPPREM